MLKKLMLAATAMTAFAAVPANAALFTVSGGSPSSPLDADNSFKANLEGLGFDTLVKGAGLTVNFTGTKGINVYVVAAESGYTNKFYIGSGTFTEHDESFDINRWIGIVASASGIGFKANGSGSLQGPGSDGFGVFTKGWTGSYSANELYLGFDDQNGGPRDDDNHDDFIVRISAVPEPATWLTMVAGFGLVGYQLRRRSSKVASAVA